MVHRESCWPTPEQELLLRASLLQGKEALEAWREWRSHVDIDRLDPSSQPLLPLLYRNLSALGVEDPLMDVFKGIYRRTWYQNQMRFHDMSAVLRSLHDAGIRTMVLKGAALVLLTYRDHGLRPMGDLDVLVPREQALAALDLLYRLGWTPKLGERPVVSESYVSVGHARGFQDARGRQLDLHWQLLYGYRYPDWDADFWDGAVSTSIHGVPTCALNPADQLLHVCVHGLWWHGAPLLRWVADAVAILRTPQSELDWNRLITQAKRHRLILPLRDTLSYLRDVVQAPIPSEVLADLQSASVSGTERMEYKIRSRPRGLLGDLPVNWVLYLRYLQEPDDGELRPHFIGFPTYLRNVWEIEHLWQVPVRAVYRGARRFYLAFTARGQRAGA